MRVGLGKNWGVLAASREAIPVAKQSLGAEGGEELFAHYFNQAIFQIGQDYVLGTASDVGFGEANIYYDSPTKTFIDEDSSPVTFASGDRITVLGINDLANELLFTANNLHFQQHPQESIDLTTYDFKITGTGCTGNLNFINCRNSSIILEGSENFLSINADLAQAILKNGQDVIENGKLSDKDFAQNLLFNAHPDVNQRGDQPTVGNSVYAADGWIHNKAGAMVSTFQVSADGPTFAQSGVAVKKCIDLTTTTTDTSLAIGDYCAISQPVEGYNILSCAGGFATLGFWVKSPVTGIHCVSFRNQGLGAGTFASPFVPDRSYIKEYTILAANTWEFQVFTVPVDDSSGTWNYDTGMGLAVTWTLAAGTTWQTTAETWQVGNFLATSNQVNVVGVVGSFKIGIPNLLTGQEWQRYISRQDEKTFSYFLKDGQVGTDSFTVNSDVDLGQATRAAFFIFLTPMRISPLISYTLSGLSSPSIVFQSNKSWSILGTATGGAGVGAYVQEWQADASIYI